MRIYRQLEYGEIVDKYDEEYIWSLNQWCNVIYHRVGKPCPKNYTIRRKECDKPVLTPLALKLIGEAVDCDSGKVKKSLEDKFIKLKQKITLTSLALDLIRRKDCDRQREEQAISPPTNVEVSNHQFPPTYIGHLWEPAGERRFEDFERSYNGVQRKLETGNLTHDLTTLIRTRG